MRVSYRSDDLLIIDIQPWLIALALSIFILIFAGAGLAALLSGEALGLVFLALGLGMGGLFVYIFVRRVQLVLDRSDNSLDIRRKTLRGMSHHTFRLEKLERAVVEVSHSSDGDTYRVALVFGPGHDPDRIPVTGYYSSGRRRKDEIADAINAFLAPR